MSQTSVPRDSDKLKEWLSIGDTDATDRDFGRGSAGIPAAGTPHYTNACIISKVFHVSMPFNPHMHVSRIFFFFVDRMIMVTFHHQHERLEAATKKEPRNGSIV